MGCPQCQWNTLTFVLETRQWICKRCGHEWKENVQRKSFPSRAIKNNPKKKTGGTKKRRSASRK
ncbi:MAG: hypothetical protein L0Y56_17935 [Nitrospira sp.]|nr:hypothetical protein [Nitrospira sp.]